MTVFAIASMMWNADQECLLMKFRIRLYSNNHDENPLM